MVALAMLLDFAPLGTLAGASGSLVLTVLSALTVGVLGALTIWKWRKRPEPKREAEAKAMLCPACGRGQPEGALYCPADAQRLVPAGRAAAEVVPMPPLCCPRCSRAFADETRFCPYDAEELVVASPHQLEESDDGGLSEITTRAGFGAGAALAPGALAGEDKICPVCATKYALSAVYCGRDGSELSSMN